MITILNTESDIETFLAESRLGKAMTSFVRGILTQLDFNVIRESMLESTHVDYRSPLVSNKQDVMLYFEICFERRCILEVSTMREPFSIKVLDYAAGKKKHVEEHTVPEIVTMVEHAILSIIAKRICE